MGLPWLAARPGVRRWSAWLSPFLNSSAVLDTELLLLSCPSGLLDRDRSSGPQVATLCRDEDTPDSESVLEPGRSEMDREMEMELVREPLGLVSTLLRGLRSCTLPPPPSSSRLSPEPILSNSARALEKRSW